MAIRVGLAVVVAFVAFMFLEAWLLPEATRETIAGFHILRGITTSAIAVGYGLILVRAERKSVRAAEERFANLADHAVDAIVEADETGTIRYANSSAARLLGRDNLVGAPLTSIMPERMRAGHNQGFARYLATRQPKILGRRLELPALRKDGSEITIELTISARPTPIGERFTGIMRDVTARKAEEDRLRADEKRWFAYLEGLPVALFAIDGAGKPAFANKKARDLLGKGTDNKADAANLSEVYPTLIAGTNEPYPAHKTPIVRVLNGERMAHSDDLELDRGNERIRLDVWASPIHDDAGNLRYAVAAFMDARDRHTAEAERLTRLQKEEELLQSRRFETLQRQFINQAAHELYTPLTPLKLDAARLEAKLGPEEAKRFSRNVDRMHEVVSQVLAVSRLQGEAATPDLLPHATGDVVRQALDKADAILQAREQRVDLALAPAAILCDGSRLSDAILHLLDNAAKYSPKKSTIQVRGTTVSGVWRLEITDPGKGWEQGMQERFFEPFARGKDEASLGQGWGLGLFIAQTIVEGHRGRITAHSPGKGKGATFTLELPLAPES